MTLRGGPRRPEAGSAWRRGALRCYAATVRRAPDVLVIGGGVIGCAVAHALAVRGVEVTLVDRGALGGEASSAAAGVLAAASSEEAEGAGLALRAASLARFATLVPALVEETGIDVEYSRAGVLEPALTDADEAVAGPRAAARRAEGFRVDRLDAAALRAAEPALAPAARSALLFPDDAHLSGGRLVAALAAAARARGAEILPGIPVHGAEREHGRLVRVRVGGDWIAPGTVVLAAGAWAPRIPGVAPDLAVEPARGQMLALRPARPLCRHVVSHAGGYLVPQPSGEVLVGATVEQAGFVKAVTPAGISALLAKATTLVPATLDAPVARLWAGLRPWAPAGGPIIERSSATANLVLACGHHRSGVLLAPITAAIVAALIAGEPPPPDARAALPPRGAGA
jgi:glycine oxidase